jgi:hypothetical protein
MFSHLDCASRSVALSRTLRASWHEIEKGKRYQQDGIELCHARLNRIAQS